MRSGVEKIEVFLNNESEPRFTVEQDCAVPDGSCAINASNPEATWHVPPDALPDGQHTVRIIATDALGHSSPIGGQQFPISVAYSDEPSQVVTMCAAHDPEEHEVDELVLAAPPEPIDDIGTQMFGSRYGGQWVDDSSCPPQVRVAVKDATANELDDFRDELKSDGRVDVARLELQTAPFTEAGLETEANVAAELLDSYGVDPYGVEYNIQSQTVVVEAQALTQAEKEEIDAAVAATVEFRLDPSYSGGVLVHGSRVEFPPYEAGLEVTTDTSVCTSAFTTVRGNDYFATTAGHCNTFDNSQVTIGGDPIGRTERNSFHNPQIFADAVRIGLTGGVSVATKRIYTGGTGHRGVTERIHAGGFRRGRSICFQGLASGTNNCGRIEHKYAKRKVDGLVFRQLVCIDEPTDTGDSGGPVYDVRDDDSARAAGIVSQKRTRSDPDMCFSRIGNVLDELNVGLAIRGER